MILRIGPETVKVLAKLAFVVTDLLKSSTLPVMLGVVSAVE